MKTHMRLWRASSRAKSTSRVPQWKAASTALRVGPYLVMPQKPQKSVALSEVKGVVGRRRYVHTSSALSIAKTTPNMEQANVTNGAGTPALPNLGCTWVGQKGAAAFDLRMYRGSPASLTVGTGDTQTTPTLAMLQAIEVATLDDDVYNEDHTTISLESHVAALSGKEAGLLVLSGTMGNQLALRSLLTQPPHSVLCDSRSHVVIHEAGGVSSLTGATVVPVLPKNGLYLTLEDIKEHVSIDDDVHTCPTRVISLENTLNGVIMPLDEVKRISEFAREHNIRMHCDGARLWEVVSSGAGSLDSFAVYFDTVSLCFSKGLGAPIGSILVGPKDIIKHARWVRKSIGGGLRQSGVIAAAARVGVDTTFGTGPNGEGGLLKTSHANAKRVEKLWTDLGGKLLLPVQTNMVWLDLDSMNTTGGRFSELGVEHGIKIGGRVVTHYQVGEEAIRRLTAVFEKVAEEKAAGLTPERHGKESGPYAK
ncbi:pyridoxal phosphate-dependent transferase [Xylariales sp. PMI_506]|nr:pyridoxal phosphate-dependent transferase [Xylariales sp. PMI_506]